MKKMTAEQKKADGGYMARIDAIVCEGDTPRSMKTRALEDVHEEMYAARHPKGSPAWEMLNEAYYECRTTDAW